MVLFCQGRHPGYVSRLCVDDGRRSVRMGFFYPKYGGGVLGHMKCGNPIISWSVADSLVKSRRNE